MFKGRFTKDGKGFKFSDWYKSKLVDYMRHNPNQPFTLTPILMESSKQRGWFEGGLCPLVAFYHEGLDHRDSKDVKKVREWLKMELNSEIVGLFGKTHRIAKSTKNELNSGFLERVVEYLVENYAPPDQAMDPKSYKHWHDAVFPYGGPDNYIDYLVSINILKKMNTQDENKSANVDERDAPNYNAGQDEEDEDVEELSDCCGAVITSQGLCSDCKEHVS